MDLKDKKILYCLFYNSRMSLRMISKYVGVTKETVNRRVVDLVDKGIIRGYSLKLDYDFLDFVEYNVFIRLKNMKDMVMDDIINYLVEDKNTTWIGKSFGKYDLKISLIFRKDNEINFFIKYFMEKFGENIENMDTLYVIYKYKSNSELFLENLFGESSFKTIKNSIYFSQNKNIVQSKNFDNSIFDEIDKKIVYELGMGVKKNLVEVSNVVNMSPETVKYRLKNLEKNSIVKGYSIVLDGSKFDKIWCIALLTLDLSILVDIEQYLNNIKSVSSYSQTIGISNFNITFFADSIKELYDVLNDFRSLFSVYIKDFDFLIFFDFYKYPKIPLCIIE